MGHDKAPEVETAEGIAAGVEFSGAKLWILVLAIFVASLGLNTNSTAVIIGAMLISPLMGPIIGMGFGVGVYDFQLLKRAFRNYLVATIFSVTTATIYFYLTPIHEAQSELLARTSPTIYDVLIALCGGLAGIIGLSSKSQRTGNVIPGVAIATALMPPLCTVGFGIANSHWLYAAGAFYLYIINTIFIALSTLIGVSCMGFHKQTLIDKKKQKEVRRTITCIALLTIVPSIIITYGIIKQTIFEQHAQQFVHNELRFKDSHVVNHNIDYKDRTINVVLLGHKVDSLTIAKVEKRLKSYHLENVVLQIVQGSDGLTHDDIQQLIANHSKEQQESTDRLTIAELNLQQTEQQLQEYKEMESYAHTLLPELQKLFPEAQAITMARGATAVGNDSTDNWTECLAVILTSQPLDETTTKRLTGWLKLRTSQPNLKVVIEKGTE